MQSPFGYKVYKHINRMKKQTFFPPSWDAYAKKMLSSLKAKGRLVEELTGTRVKLESARSAYDLAHTPG